MSIEENLARIADALEVIAAAKTGNDAPRTASTTSTAKDADKDKDKDKAAKDKAAKDKAAKDKAAKDKKVADDDPFGDGDGGDGGDAKKSYTDKDVREILSKLIDQDGKAAAFEVLKDKGDGAKNFGELKKEHYEDVYVACEERLA